MLRPKGHFERNLCENLILIIDEGKLTEPGTHDELIAAIGHYADRATR